MVHNGRGVVLDGSTQLPTTTKPLDLTAGVLPSIRAKSGTRYGPIECASAILVVHHVQWPALLDARDLERIGEFATSIASRFKEIWIVNNYGDPAQRVPFGRMEPIVHE